jgi:hypothetical protein
MLIYFLPRTAGLGSTRRPFDDLVGAGEQRGRNGQAERLSGLWPRKRIIVAPFPLAPGSRIEGKR